MPKTSDLKTVLLKTGYIAEEDFIKAEVLAKKEKRDLREVLLKEAYISKDILGQAFSEYYKIPYSDLNSISPSKEQVLMIPEASAKKFRIVVFNFDEKEGITIATDAPNKKGLKTELTRLFPKKKVKITYSVSEDIDDIFINYRKSLDTRFSKIIKAKGRIAPEILNEIFLDATTFDASDIHFEPQGDKVLIRFRIDGVLQEAGSIPRDLYENILNRIKVQSNLRIDQHRGAQDGSMRFESNDNKFDLRTSIVPTVEGEKIVLRILASYVKRYAYEELGLNKRNAELIERASKLPFGMILTTGPTGSGKTTTLYSILKSINRPDINITTIEDPVEYRVIGINQIQVNTETGLTFAKGLRSIVRQDPDVILVGEIRDLETAEIAVNAALTGHLLFSTFHANDASTAIPRLLDMGTEAFLLSSTLETVSAQRLLRKVCDSCRVSFKMTKKEIESLAKHAEKHISHKTTFYKGKGCNACNGTGYRGRIGVFEFIEITPEMRNLILTNPSTQQIWELADSQGAMSLFDDGMEKVKTGVTSIEELLRVVSIPHGKAKK